MWLVPVVGILVAAGLIAVVIYAGNDSHSPSASSDKVKIEVRAMPPADIRIDGKKVGTTPIALQFPRSAKLITIEATMTRHLVKRGATKDEIYKGTQIVTPDRDRTVDFSLSNANLVESQVNEK